jgi:hypothetical protein
MICCERHMGSVVYDVSGCSSYTKLANFIKCCMFMIDTCQLIYLPCYWMTAWRRSLCGPYDSEAQSSIPVCERTLGVGDNPACNWIYDVLKSKAILIAGRSGTSLSSLRDKSFNGPHGFLHDLYSAGTAHATCVVWSLSTSTFRLV